MDGIITLLFVLGTVFFTVLLSARKANKGKNTKRQPHQNQYTRQPQAEPARQSLKNQAQMSLEQAPKAAAQTVVDAKQPLRPSGDQRAKVQKSAAKTKGTISPLEQGIVWSEILGKPKGWE